MLRELCYTCTGYFSLVVENVHTYALIQGFEIKTNLNRITKLQKGAARIVLAKAFETSSKDMFYKLKWL